MEGGLRRAQSWVLSWAQRPRSILALFILAFSESIFFPIPPDVLLIVLALAQPNRAFKYATVCVGGSVLGGIGGFLLGMKFWQISQPLLFTYISPERFNQVRELFQRYEAWAIGIAGFTPIPYKVFTLSAGFFRVDFPTFLIASIASRGARFFLVGWLSYLFGIRAKGFIERYFNILTIALVALLILGFILLRWIL